MEGDIRKLENSKNYKFKGLQVYASTEWLADNKKKYRQVFDKNKTAFVYVELSFYNKNYDVATWEAKVRLKCYRVSQNKTEICSLTFNKNISKYDAVAYIREGWGNKEAGSFWTKGTYYWEAWIGEEKIATKYFYIEHLEEKDDDVMMPNLELKSVHLYEGKYEGVDPSERKYYQVFDVENTRYVYAEVTCENLCSYSSWQCELILKVFNESRELKAEVSRLVEVKEQEDEIKVVAGWGANLQGSWRKGIYMVEVVYLDCVIGTMPFVVADEFVEGKRKIIEPPTVEGLMRVKTDDVDASSLEELMMNFERLIGLKKIKEKVRNHSEYLKFIQLRKEKGFKEEHDFSLHVAFKGNPGTGKTTVAKMMGKIYRKMGLLSSGHVHEVDRVSLVGEYIGQTAPKVKEAIDKARGGILFIDEAYALARSNDDTKDFGREVIEILIRELSDGEGDLAVIVAGYPAEMDYFLNSNPGLKSRFKLVFDFDDYRPTELNQIMEYACHEMELEVEPEAKEILHRMFLKGYRERDKSFGNARFVQNILEQAKINMGLRIMKAEDPKAFSLEALKLITVDDVLKLKNKENVVRPLIPIDEELLEEAMSELNGLVGLNHVKTEIKELTALVRYHIEKGDNPLERLSLHTAYIGNPGTGKTTIARIVAKIFRALGILERGHIVETDRQGLVAGYVGQTAMKTSKKIDEAIGGILFIDEAYSLTRSTAGQGDFGQEAIQTLLKRMEDDRGKFFVIVAGYPTNMAQFFKSNPGLQSRFDRMLRFEDYRPQGLFDIATKMIQEDGSILSEQAREILKEVVHKMVTQKDKYFGNAREIRKLVSQIIKHQHLRLADSKDAANEVIREDIVKATEQLSKPIFVGHKIGY